VGQAGPAALAPSPATRPVLGDRLAVAVVRHRQVMDVRIAVRLPLWVRALVVASRAVGWLTRRAWAWRLELCAAGVVLLARAVLASVVGLDAATIAVAAVIAGLLV
jgi:hypothetical protein